MLQTMLSITTYGIRLMFYALRQISNITYARFSHHKYHNSKLELGLKEYKLKPRSRFNVFNALCFLLFFFVVNFYLVFASKYPNMCLLSKESGEMISNLVFLLNFLCDIKQPLIHFHAKCLLLPTMHSWRLLEKKDLQDYNGLCNVQSSYPIIPGTFYLLFESEVLFFPTKVMKMK